MYSSATEEYRLFKNFINNLSYLKDISYLTLCVGFHLSHGNSPDCGSSIGGWRIEIQRSPFWKK